MRVTNRDEAVGAGAVCAGMTLMLDSRRFPSCFTSLMSSVEASRLGTSQMQSAAESNIDKTSESGYSCNPSTIDDDPDSQEAQSTASMPHDSSARLARPVELAAPAKSALLRFDPKGDQREQRWRMCCFVAS